MWQSATPCSNPSAHENGNEMKTEAEKRRQEQQVEDEKKQIGEKRKSQKKKMTKWGLKKFIFFLLK